MPSKPLRTGKTMKWRSFFIGGFTGAVVSSSAFLLKGGYDALDCGLSTTYGQAEMDRWRGGRDLLLSLAEPHWLGLSQSEAKLRLERLGIFGFLKGGLENEPSLIVAQTNSGRGQIVLSIDGSGHVSKIEY